MAVEQKKPKKKTEIMQEPENGFLFL